MFEKPHDYKDITAEAYITLSSVAHSGGVDELLAESADMAWRTNEKTPHKMLLTFQKKTDIAFIMLYLDHERDESYCPSEMKVELGWGTNDWWYVGYRRILKPKGWVRIPLHDNLNHPRRCMVVQLTVTKNHESGRDCVIRHLRVIAPVTGHYDNMNGLILGPCARMETTQDTKHLKETIMLNYLSLR
uniref:Anaphase-promoting complex subunit 10 n=1 Tax=Caenorhabditis japonica TaxID=281687 RepID=A0A8R1HYX6_CAEJA